MDGRRKRVVLVAVGILLVFAVVIPVWVLPAVLVHWAEKTVNEACEGCSLKIEGAHLWLFPPGFRVESAKLVAGADTSTEVRVDSGEVSGRLRLFSLLRRRFFVENITVEYPDVVVIDKPAPPKKELKKAPEPPEENPWRWHVGGATVSDAKFRFERHAQGKVAKLAFDRIQARSKPFRVEDGKVDPLIAECDARLEQTGKVHVQVSVLSLQKPMKIEVDAAVADQPLDRANRYFFPDAGIQLYGHLVDSKAHVSVQDKKLQSSVNAEFKGLEVKVSSNADRGGLLAGLMEFAAAMKLREENQKSKPEDRIDRASLEREPNESIVPFILRGLKEAAMAVASRR